MKSYLEPASANGERMMNRVHATTDGMDNPDLCVEAGVPEGFRRLRWNEVVCLGDFVVDARHGFQLWDGPRGFRADAFVKPTYRRDASRPTAARC